MSIENSRSGSVDGQWIRDNETKEFENWFRDHWEEMKDEDLIYQVRSHAYNFSESFLREFKDEFNIFDLG